MVRVFTTRVNCLPMCAAKAGEAALTLPVSALVARSWAPWRVMFSGGFPFMKNKVVQSWEVLSGVVPQSIRLTLE